MSERIMEEILDEEFPEPSEDLIKTLESGLGVRYNRATREWKALVLRDGKLVDPDTGV